MPDPRRTIMFLAFWEDLTPRRDRRHHRPAARHGQEPRAPWPDRAPPHARGGAPWLTLTSTSWPRSSSTPPTQPDACASHVDVLLRRARDQLDSLVAVRRAAWRRAARRCARRPAATHVWPRRPPTRGRRSSRRVPCRGPADARHAARRGAASRSGRPASRPASPWWPASASGGSPSPSRSRPVTPDPGTVRRGHRPHRPRQRRPARRRERGQRTDDMVTLRVQRQRARRRCRASTRSG